MASIPPRDWRRPALGWLLLLLLLLPAMPPAPRPILAAAALLGLAALGLACGPAHRPRARSPRPADGQGEPGAVVDAAA